MIMATGFQFEPQLRGARARARPDWTANRPGQVSKSPSLAGQNRFLTPPSCRNYHILKELALRLGFCHARHCSGTLRLKWGGGLSAFWKAKETELIHKDFIAGWRQQARLAEKHHEYLE